MAHDREIAGIRCTQILDCLSDYLAGELTPDTRTRIETHLAQCAWCEQFGGEFGSVIQQLRLRLAEPNPVSSEEVNAVLDAMNL